MLLLLEIIPLVCSKHADNRAIDRLARPVVRGKATGSLTVLDRRIYSACYAEDRASNPPDFRSFAASRSISDISVSGSK